MWVRRLGELAGVFCLATSASLIPICLSQTQSGNQSWTSTDQQGSPDGAINPTRTSNTHSETNGRTLDKTSVERLGPDGRYVPYSDTEKESIRVNDTTVRNVERTYGRDADGRRVLIQETQEESRKLPSGESSLTRTISHPDVNGGLQLVRRESEESKQLSPNVRVTKSTVLTPDANGGFSPAVQTEERETRRDNGTVDSKKSTLLSNGNGGLTLSEVRESTSKQEGNQRSKEERVLRPDGNGNLTLVERTVNKQDATASGENRETTETFSPNVPGMAGDGSLQLVRRETVRQFKSAGGKSTVRQVEQPQPGAPEKGMQVTQQTIDIVRPGSNSTASETHSILSPDPDGQLHQVWVDIGKTKDPAAVQVDMGSSSKPK